MTVSNVVIRVPSIKKDAEQIWHGTDDDVARLDNFAYLQNYQGISEQESPLGH